MKTALPVITAFLVPFSEVLAHEGETEITNLAEAEWAGPLIAVLAIAVVIFLARTIRKRSSHQITNGNTTN